MAVPWEWKKIGTFGSLRERETRSRDSVWCCPSDPHIGAFRRIRIGAHPAASPFNRASIIVLHSRGGSDQQPIPYNYSPVPTGAAMNVCPPMPSTKRASDLSMQIVKKARRVVHESARGRERHARRGADHRGDSIASAIRRLQLAAYWKAARTRQGSISEKRGLFLFRQRAGAVLTVSAEPAPWAAAV